MVCRTCFWTVLFLFAAWTALSPVSARLPDGPARTDQLVLSEPSGARFVTAIETIARTYPKCRDEGCNWIHVDKNHYFNILCYNDRSAPIILKFTMEEVTEHTKRLVAVGYWPPERTYWVGCVDLGASDNEPIKSELTPMVGDELKGTVGPVIEMLETIAEPSEED